MSANRWKEFKTAKAYAKGKFIVDLQQKKQSVRLFHAGNASVKVKLITTIDSNEVALSYPRSQSGPKKWEWPITLGSVSAPGMFRPATNQTEIEHDNSICPIRTTHEIKVASEFDRGPFRGTVNENGEFVFDC